MLFNQQLNTQHASECNRNTDLIALIALVTLLLLLLFLMMMMILMNSQIIHLSCTVLDLY